MFMHHRWLINPKKNKVIYGGSIEFDIYFWLHSDAVGGATMESLVGACLQHLLISWPLSNKEL